MLCTLLTPLLTYIYSIWFSSPHSGKERPSDISLDIIRIVEAVESLLGMPVLRFGEMKTQTFFLDLYISGFKQCYRRLSKKVDLSDARKKASKMSRKDLHRMSRNAISRHLHNRKIRLDRGKIEKIQLALENNKLSLSVTASDDVIESLFSNLTTPSTYASLHIPNLHKLKHGPQGGRAEDRTRRTYHRHLWQGTRDWCMTYRTHRCHRLQR